MGKHYNISNSHQPIQKRAIGSLFCVLILFYLGFHTVSGERGVFALIRESHRLDMLQNKLSETKSERIILENKTKKLSNNSLDLDLLDEQTRLVLGISGKNEVVLFENNQK